MWFKKNAEENELATITIGNPYYTVGFPILDHGKKWYPVHKYSAPWHCERVEYFETHEDALNYVVMMDGPK